MAKEQGAEQFSAVDLLQKMLVFQLHAMDVPQTRIAKTVGKQTVWVNELLKGIAKGGKASGRQAKA